MKVDVIQAKDIEFSKYRFWSDWIDICIYSYSDLFLLQMRVNRFNKKQFKSISISSSMFRYRSTSISSVGNLTQMSLPEKIDYNE